MKRLFDWISAKVLDKILATITSGGGGLIAYFSPIIQHTGIPLAILIGATFGLLLFDVIKRLFFEKQYTGETFFNINFKDGANNLDKSPNIRNVHCVKIDADKVKYDSKEVKAYIVIIEHEQLEGYLQLKPHPYTNRFHTESSGKYCTILGVMMNKTDDSLQQYKITFTKQT